MTTRSATKTKKITLSPAFSQGKSSTLKDVEAEYIKNLQQQIHFLELEAEFLREQAQKATNIHPKMTKEAERMMFKLKELERELDGLKLELTRKEASINMLSNEKSRLAGELKVLDDTYVREKTLLTHEVIELKKLKEIADQQIAIKDGEIIALSQRLERTGTDLRHEMHNKNLLQSQFDQRCLQHNQTTSLLDEKRAECLKQQTQMHYLEEKFNTSTIAMQDKITRELQEEINGLRNQLRQTELTATQDRILKDKLVENVSKLTHENASLHSQMLDANKQMDREKLLRTEKDNIAAQNASRITLLKGSEEVLSHETRKLKEMLEHERRKNSEMEAKMLKAQDGLSTTTYHSRTLQARVDEIEGRFGKVDSDNVQLRRDKQILVEHIQQLQQKLDLKEAELLRMESHMHTLQTDVTSLKADIDRSKSLHTENLNRLSQTVGSMNLTATSS